MNTQDVYPDRYMRAEFLEGPVTVTFEKIVKEEMYDERSRSKISKPVAYFVKATKGVVIGPKNWHTIAKAYGNESDAWVGKKVTLAVKEYNINHEIEIGIEVLIPKANGYAPSPEAAKAVAELFPEPTMPTTTTKEPKS